MSSFVVLGHGTTVAFDIRANRVRQALRRRAQTLQPDDESCIDDDPKKISLLYGWSKGISGDASNMNGKRVVVVNPEIHQRCCHP